MLVPVSGAGVHIAAVPVSSHLVHLSSVSPAVSVDVLSSVPVPAAELCVNCINCINCVSSRTLTVALTVARTFIYFTALVVFHCISCTDTANFYCISCHFFIIFIALVVPPCC